MIESSFSNSLFQLYKDLLSRLRSVQLTQLKSGISHEPVIPQATYAPWRDDKEFQVCYQQIKTHTLVDEYRCYELWQLTRQLGRLSGDILEVGVWRGGTGVLMALASNDSTSKVVLCDTFEGVVKASERDSMYKGGEHADTTAKEVHSLAVQTGVTQRVSVLKGIYPDSFLQRTELFPSGIKLCHIDVDTYESAKDIFEDVWPRMIHGGVVIFDDYGFWGCEGVTQFCNDIRTDIGIFIMNLNGHGIFIKV